MTAICRRKAFRGRTTDDPASLDRDSLGRLSLAKSIYTLVKDAPDDWTLRIGIYGAWGEGKTSLLNLVASLAQADGLPVRGSIRL